MSNPPSGPPPVSEASAQETSPSHLTTTAHSWFETDGIEQYSIFPIQRQSYIEILPAPEYPEYDASSHGVTARSQVMSTMNFKNLTPYKLDYTNSGLFPEWYFLFILAFGKMDPVLYDYCHMTPENFRANFHGNELEISLAVSKIENVFSEAVRQNISFSNETRKAKYYRKTVETTLVKELSQWRSPKHLLVRQQKLVDDAETKGLGSLVRFYQASCIAPVGIWIHIGSLFYLSSLSDDAQLSIRNKINHFSKMDTDLHTSVMLFQEEMIIKGYYPIPARNTNSPARFQATPAAQPAQPPGHATLAANPQMHNGPRPNSARTEKRKARREQFKENKRSNNAPQRAPQPSNATPQMPKMEPMQLPNSQDIVDSGFPPHERRARQIEFITTRSPSFLLQTLPKSKDFSKCKRINTNGLVCSHRITHYRFEKRVTPLNKPEPSSIMIKNRVYSETCDMIINKTFSGETSVRE